MFELVVDIFRMALDYGATYFTRISLGGLTLLEWCLGLVCAGFLIKAVSAALRS